MEKQHNLPLNTVALWSDMSDETLASRVTARGLG
jgi:hypothetical protein